MITRCLTLVLLLSAVAPASAAGGSLKADVKALGACLAKTESKPGACVGIISGPCQEEPDGASTPGIDACLGRETEAWDSILNANYAATLSAAKELDQTRKADGDAEASAALGLVKAQRAWIAYRDAECERRFEVYKDGTIRTNIASSCMLDLTATRAVDLSPDEN